MLPEIRAVNIGSLERGLFHHEFKSRVFELTTQTHIRVDTMSIAKKKKTLAHNQ